MVKIKKVYKILLIVLILITLTSNLFQFVFADDIDEENEEAISKEEIDEVSNEIKTEPIINSRRCIIYDRESKRILYGKNENVKSAMASTTKILTSIIVLEKTDNLDKTITITAKAAGIGGSRIGLKKDDKITIRDLLYGLLMKSGNDAAVALAIEVGGSIEGFANLMNQKVEELGLTKSHFVTPEGLDNPEHYTTAYELAKITDYALENKTFANIVATKNYTITINGYAKALNNTNELLGTLNGVIGVKTGFTNGAGRCLVTETKRGNMDIIVIVLGADTKKDRTKDSMKLIKYAFENFQKINLENAAKEEFDSWNQINSGRIIINKAKNSKIELKLNEIKTKKIYIKIEDIDKVEYTINSLVEANAPIEKGSKIGTLSIKLNGEIIEDIDIVCKTKVKKKNIWDYFKENIKLIRCYNI